MKIHKKISCFVAAVLCMALVFTSCGKAGQSNAGAEKTDKQAAENASVPETEMEEDNYGQIIKKEDVQGKLQIYFMSLSVSENTKDKAGDASLILSPDGQVMLIDSGHPDCGWQVVRFLKDMGITKIDAYVESHPHIDHIGGFKEVAENFEIDHVYRTNVEHTTKTYQSFVQAIEDGGYTVTYLKAGDTFEFGSDIHVEIFHPEEEVIYPDNFPEGATQFLNDTSLTMKMTYGESSILYAGDLYTSGESEVLKTSEDKLQADVIKANHHGRDTSNMKQWIQAVSPKIVVAMDETLQSPRIIKDYNKVGAFYYLTAINGFVRVTMDDKKNYEVLTQFGEALKP